MQQDFFLFSGNVAQNISLNEPTVTDEAMRSRLREVAGRLSRRLPGGYDSQVRERGGGFSVGEKQLVSFARALACVHRC